MCVGLEAGTWTPQQKANLRKAAIKGWSRVMAMHQHLLLLALDPGSYPPSVAVLSCPPTTRGVERIESLRLAGGKKGGEEEGK